MIPRSTWTRHTSWSLAVLLAILALSNAATPGLQASSPQSQDEGSPSAGQTQPLKSYRSTNDQGQDVKSSINQMEAAMREKRNARRSPALHTENTMPYNDGRYRDTYVQRGRRSLNQYLQSQGRPTTGPPIAPVGHSKPAVNNLQRQQAVSLPYFSPSGSAASSAGSPTKPAVDLKQQDAPLNKPSSPGSADASDGEQDRDQNLVHPDASTGDSPSTPETPFGLAASNRQQNQPQMSHDSDPSSAGLSNVQPSSTKLSAAPRENDRSPPKSRTEDNASASPLQDLQSDTMSPEAHRIYSINRPSFSYDHIERLRQAGVPQNPYPRPGSQTSPLPASLASSLEKQRNHALYIPSSSPYSLSAGNDGRNDQHSLQNDEYLSQGGHIIDFHNHPNPEIREAYHRLQRDPDGLDPLGAPTPKPGRTSPPRLTHSQQTAFNTGGAEPVPNQGTDESLRKEKSSSSPTSIENSLKSGTSPVSPLDSPRRRPSAQRQSSDMGSEAMGPNKVEIQSPQALSSSGKESIASGGRSHRDEQEVSPSSASKSRHSDDASSESFTAGGGQQFARSQLGSYQSGSAASLDSEPESVKAAMRHLNIESNGRRPSASTNSIRSSNQNSPRDSLSEQLNAPSEPQYSPRQSLLEHFGSPRQKPGHVNPAFVSHEGLEPRLHPFLPHPAEEKGRTDLPLNQIGFLKKVLTPQTQAVHFSHGPRKQPLNGFPIKQSKAENGETGHTFRETSQNGESFTNGHQGLATQAILPENGKHLTQADQNALDQAILPQNGKHSQDAEQAILPQNGKHSLHADQGLAEQNAVAQNGKLSPHTGRTVSPINGKQSKSTDEGLSNEAVIPDVPKRLIGRPSAASKFEFNSRDRGVLRSTWPPEAPGVKSVRRVPSPDTKAHLWETFDLSSDRSFLNPLYRSREGSGSSSSSSHSGKAREDNGSMRREYESRDHDDNSSDRDGNGSVASIESKASKASKSSKGSGLAALANRFTNNGRPLSTSRSADAQIRKEQLDHASKRPSEESDAILHRLSPKEAKQDRRREPPGLQSMPSIATQGSAHEGGYYAFLNPEANPVEKGHEGQPIPDKVPIWDAHHNAEETKQLFGGSQGDFESDHSTSDIGSHSEHFNPHFLSPSSSTWRSPRLFSQKYGYPLWHPMHGLPSSLARPSGDLRDHVSEHHAGGKSFASSRAMYGTPLSSQDSFESASDQKGTSPLGNHPYFPLQSDSAHGSHASQHEYVGDGLDHQRDKHPFAHLDHGHLATNLGEPSFLGVSSSSPHSHGSKADGRLEKSEHHGESFRSDHAPSIQEAPKSPSVDDRDHVSGSLQHHQYRSGRHSGLFKTLDMSELMSPESRPWWRHLEQKQNSLSASDSGTDESHAHEGLKNKDALRGGFKADGGWSRRDSDSSSPKSEGHSANLQDMLYGRDPSHTQDNHDFLWEQLGSTRFLRDSGRSSRSGNLHTFRGAKGNNMAGLLRKDTGMAPSPTQRQKLRTFISERSRQKRLEQQIASSPDTQHSKDSQSATRHEQSQQNQRDSADKPRSRRKLANLFKRRKSDASPVSRKQSVLSRLFSRMSPRREKSTSPNKSEGQQFGSIGSSLRNFFKRPSSQADEELDPAEAFGWHRRKPVDSDRFEFKSQKPGVPKDVHPPDPTEHPKRWEYQEFRRARHKVRVRDEAVSRSASNAFTMGVTSHPPGGQANPSESKPSDRDRPAKFMTGRSKLLRLPSNERDSAEDLGREWSSRASSSAKVQGDVRQGPARRDSPDQSAFKFTSNSPKQAPETPSMPFQPSNGNAPANSPAKAPEGSASTSPGKQRALAKMKHFFTKLRGPDRRRRRDGS